jgi:hypothetical protein
MKEIQEIGATIQTAQLMRLYACELKNDVKNRAVVELANERIEAGIAVLATLYSNDPADWKVKAQVLMMWGDLHLDAALSSLALSLAQDVILT